MSSRRLIMIPRSSHLSAHAPDRQGFDHHGDSSDGQRMPLLHIDQWDFNWQGYYEYAKPISLPKGTVVAMDNIHDNSAENPANPNHPPRPVTGGEQTTNEMSAVVLHLMADHPPRARRRPAHGVGPDHAARRPRRT
jgi:hypothetical protein